MKSGKFTEEEKNFIKDNRDKMSRQELATALDRDKYCVTAFISRALNCENPKKVQRDITEQETSFLIANYSKFTTNELCKILDRHKNFIVFHLRKLGLKTKNQIRQDIEKELSKDGLRKCEKCSEVKPYEGNFKHKHIFICYSCLIKDELIRQERRSSGSLKSFIKYKLKTIRRKCLEKNRPFALTSFDIEELYNKQDGKCFYTGQEMNFRKGNLLTMSVDRIDSSKGYLPDNIVLSCQSVNFMKQAYSTEVFLNTCKLATEHQAKKVLENINSQVNCKINE